MGSTIKNLYEITCRPLLRDRLAAGKNGFPGLGPDDLVVLDKSEKGFLQSPVVVHFYHHLNGIRHNPTTFPAYYADLVRRQEPGGRLPTSHKYTIVRGRLFCWNSFRGCEARLTVKKPPRCECQVLGRNGEESEMTDDDWFQIRLSSELRFFRAGQPLLYTMFGTRVEKSPALLTHRMEPMTWKDMVYVIDNHPLDDELSAALASAMLIGLEMDRIGEFLMMYGHRIPSVYSHMMRYVTPQCYLAEMLKPLAENHWMIFCDNVDLALKLIQYNIARGEDVGKYIPIIKSAIWCNPMAALCMSKMEIGRGNYERAFNLINASAHSLNWPLSTADYIAPQLTKPKTALPYKAAQEGRIVGAPFVGMNAASFAVTAELIETVAFEPFSKTFLKKMTDKRRTSGSIASFSIWPPINFRFKKEAADQLCLYDPGIEDDKVSEVKMVDQLPYSHSFRNLIGDVSNALQRKYNLLNDVLPSKKDKLREDAISVTILGLRLRCGELIRKGFEMTKENPKSASSLVKLLLLKAQIDGYGPGLDEIFGMNLNEVNISDMNALAFVEDLAVALDRTRE